MSYKITIGTDVTLRVCVGKFGTFEEAKEQMSSYIIELIEKQKNDNSWSNFIEDFPEEIQDILVSFEENGCADFDDCVSNYYGTVTYSADESEFEATGKPDFIGCSLEIHTNTINMYDADETYFFSLTVNYGSSRSRITVKLYAEDDAVEVYNVIPDETRSLLTPIDY